MSWREPAPTDRQVAWLWGACVVIVVALRPLLVAAAALLPPCLWHAWTGWPCPGCGSTRALLHLLRLDVGGAVALNPLATAGASAFLLGGVVAPAWIACGGRVPVVPPGPKPACLAAVVVAVLANWGWLIVAGV